VVLISPEQVKVDVDQQGDFDAQNVLSMASRRIG